MSLNLKDQEEVIRQYRWERGSRYKDLIQEGQRLERKSQRGKRAGEVGQVLAEAVHGGRRRGRQIGKVTGRSTGAELETLIPRLVWNLNVQGSIYCEIMNTNRTRMKRL